tara:strand:- start:714 stop:944 length:231 start_codon:yes stop_codon:yes gene_type:complete
MARVTTQQVQADLILLREQNTMEHNSTKSTMEQLHTDIKDNRKYFDTRLDKLDSKIWGLVMLTISTLVAVITTMII